MTSLTEKKRIIRETAARFEPLRPPRPFTESDREQADEIAGGTVRYNAHMTDGSCFPIAIGRRDIDWSGGHHHHQEWPTQMSRFFMLGPLMAAYRQSPDGRYAEAAKDYIDDWIAHFPLEETERRGNTCMDIAIRLGTHGFGGWAVALPVFMDDPAWDDAFVTRMLDSMERQARILWKKGIPSRLWGNHRIFGLDGLLHLCLRQPFIADSAAMLRTCRNGLRDALRQFLPDGAHIEETLGYHDHMTGTFLYLERLDRAFPEADLKLDVKRLLKAVDYFLHTLPGGINDTHADRLDKPYAAEWARARGWRKQLTGRDEPGWAPAPDAVFPDAGQVFLRSSWQPGADFLAFDAGPYSGAHAHLARLGLVFRSGGRLWLADPGTFDYEMSNPFALYGRSTPAHCTANLEGLNQGNFDSHLVVSDVAAGHALLHGVYPGSYWDGVYTWGFQKGLGRGTSGRHERIVLWIRNEYLLVLDAIMTGAGPAMETVWQLPPVPKWKQDPAALSWESEGEPVNFFLRLLLAPKGGAMTVHEGQKDPLRGWFAETYGRDFKPAPQVVFHTPAVPVFHATLALPLPAGARPPATVERPFGSGRCLELSGPDGRVDRLYLAASLCAPLDELEGLETDSPLAWIRFDAEGKPLRSVRLGGTFLNYGGKEVRG